MTTPMTDMEGAERRWLDAVAKIERLQQELDEARATLPDPETRTLHIVFDRLPCPDGARFIDVEDDTGRSVRVGEWRQRPDGQAVLVLAASAPDGVELAARFVQDRLDGYVNDHGCYDYSTGVTEFPGTGEEYVGELEEIIDGIRALKARLVHVDRPVRGAHD